MTDSIHTTLLRRMTRPQKDDVADNPLTSSRAVRLALTKAANDAVGLKLTVLGVGEEIAKLDDMLGALGDDMMLVSLMRGDQLDGIIAFDMQLRAAVVEMQTMGAVIGQAAEDRAPTRTDKTLNDPLISAFLAAFPSTMAGTDLDGWGNDVAHGDRIDSVRAAGLVLNDCNYRIVRMTVDLGVADRQGLLFIALPLIEHAVDEQAAPPALVNWDAAFQEAVSDAPASLTALLHRFKVPLTTANSLKVGTVLPLTGCTVNSVRLMASDGQEVAQAKLGQTAGMRAVRLQLAPPPQLAELGSGAAIDIPNGMVEIEMPDSDPMDAMGGFDVEIDMAEPAEMALDVDMALDGFAPMTDDSLADEAAP
jgi:flagellar motor switch protein FliM